MDNRTRWIRRVLGGAVAAALMGACLSGTAAAAQPTSATFAAQAKAGGLTATQAAGLQAEVDSYLAQLGGRQIAANAIDLDGTGVAVLPVPGKNKVRDLSGSMAPLREATGTCFVADFCVWQRNNESGAFIAKFACNSAVNFPRSNPDWLAPVPGGGLQGSYWNNQTGGAHAFVYRGVNATGVLNFSPPVGDPVDFWPWGGAPVDRSFEACH